jgi:hypothetical protein
LPGISLKNYLCWLTVLVCHPRSWTVIDNVLQWELSFAWPLIFFLFVPKMLRFWNSDGSFYKVAMSLFAGFILVIVPASKEGADYHHIWPFIPWICYVVARWLQSLKVLALPFHRLLVIHGCLFAWVLSLSLVTNHETEQLVYYFSHKQEFAWQEEDVKNILARFPDTPVQMGFGEGRNFSYTTYVQPLIYQRPIPCILNLVTATELAGAGISLKPAGDLILNQKDTVWLIPKNERPFSATSFYTPHPRLFDDSFVDEFIRHHRKIGSSMFFDIYQYNSP